MRFVDEIKKVFNNKDRVISHRIDSLGNNVKVSFLKNKPIDDVLFLEGCNKHIVPKQYMDLIAYADGMSLFNYDNIDGLQLLGYREVLEFTRYARNTFEEEWEDNITIFAKIIGEDNYIGFRKHDDDSYSIIDCYFEESPSEWEMIEEDLDCFLMRYYMGNGKKYWIE